MEYRFWNHRFKEIRNEGVQNIFAMLRVVGVEREMNWEFATKKQLLQIALYEDCPMDDKYAAARELQLRFRVTDEMVSEMVRLYGRGYSPFDIAIELGIEEYVVRDRLQKLGVWKRRVEA